MKLQKGALSLLELAIGGAVVAVISTAMIMSYDSSDSKAETMIATQREVAAGLLRMKQDFSCYPLKLSGLIKREDAEQNACGGINDLSNWKGPYVSSSMNITPTGEIRLNKIAPEATLTLVRVGNAWTLKTEGIKNDILQKAFVACPESEACLKMVNVNNGPGGIAPVGNEDAQFGLVFDGILPPGSNVAPIAVVNQNAVAAINPNGSFGPIGAISGNTVYSGAGVAATAVNPVVIGNAPNNPGVTAPTAPTIAGPVVYAPGAPGYVVPPPVVVPPPPLPPVVPPPVVPPPIVPPLPPLPPIVIPPIVNGVYNAAFNEAQTCTVVFLGAGCSPGDAPVVGWVDANETPNGFERYINMNDQSQYIQVPRGGDPSAFTSGFKAACTAWGAAGGSGPTPPSIARFYNNGGVWYMRIWTCAYVPIMPDDMP